jgi:hypothetical protein
MGLSSVRAKAVQALLSRKLMLLEVYTVDLPSKALPFGLPSILAHRQTSTAMFVQSRLWLPICFSKQYCGLQA